MLDNFTELRFAKQMLKKKQRQFGSLQLPKEKLDAYSRDQNPAVMALCQTLANLEKAEDCVVTSFGLGAILTLCVAHLKRGDHILVSKNCFGSQERIFNKRAESFGFDVTFVDDDAAWNKEVRSTTRMAFLSSSEEEPTACAHKIEERARMLHERADQNIHVVVDNTRQTNRNVKPLDHGADFVLYTSTKGLEENPSVVAGAICGRKDEMKSVAQSMCEAKVCVSPFNAWAILRGLGGESMAVLDRILGVGSKDDSGKVVSLQERSHAQAHGFPALV